MSLDITIFIVLSRILNFAGVDETLLQKKSVKFSDQNIGFKFVMADTTEIKNHVSQKRPVLAKSLMDSSEPEPSSRVLVIYTGGTIGMKTNDNGGLKINSSLFIHSMFPSSLHDLGLFSILNIVNFGHVIVFSW